MPEITELSAKQRRTALAVLHRERLAQITQHYELEVGDRRIALHHVDAIVRARRVSFADVLGLLSRDELKSICHTLGLDEGGREKQVLIDRILGTAGGPAASTSDTVTPPPESSGKPSDTTKKRSPIEIIEKLNDLFEGELTDQDKLVYVNDVLKGKLLESETLQQQAANNTKEQFASSPDLNRELLNAIMGALDAHTSTRTRR